jgi:hypothetical protein
MHWEFQHTFADAVGVSAVASADGMTAIVDLIHAPSGFGVETGPHFTRLDLSTGAVTPMPVQVGVGAGQAISIAIVSVNEAYAVISNASPGLTGSKIVCWNGTEWIARGQPATGVNEGNFSLVAADPAQTPATIFASTTNKIYISRDSAKTWVRASLGLPESISWQAIHCVRDSLGSHVYLPTYGRSVWTIATKETG